MINISNLTYEEKLKLEKTLSTEISLHERQVENMIYDKDLKKLDKIFLKNKNMSKTLLFHTVKHWNNMYNNNNIVENLDEKGLTFFKKFLSIPSLEADKYNYYVGNMMKGVFTLVSHSLPLTKNFYDFISDTKYQKMLNGYFVTLDFLSHIKSFDVIEYLFDNIKDFESLSNIELQQLLFIKDFDIEKTLTLLKDKTRFFNKPPESDDWPSDLLNLLLSIQDRCADATETKRKTYLFFKSIDKILDKKITLNLYNVMLTVLDKDKESYGKTNSISKVIFHKIFLNNIEIYGDLFYKFEDIDYVGRKFFNLLCNLSVSVEDLRVLLLTNEVCAKQVIEKYNDVDFSNNLLEKLIKEIAEFYEIKHINFVFVEKNSGKLKI